MEHFKKILCIVLVLLSLVSVLPFSSSAASQLAINGSSVEEDLAAWGIDLSQFPKNADDKSIRLMHMLEYGYDEKGNFIDYGIYLYFYNPSGIAIQNSDLNKVQLAVLDANGEQLRYKKYGLSLISFSSSNGYENVFYKFRVENSVTFAPLLNKSKRQYKISGAELLRVGEETADGFAPEYRLDSHYIWTGYQSFYNKDRKAMNTLYYERTDMDVLSLDLFPATWMSATSDLGEGHRYEVFSVYFAVDNYFIRKYGNPADDTSGLRRVSGEYNEYVIDGVMSDSSDVVNAFDAVCGYTLNSEDWLLLPNSYKKYCFYNKTGETVDAAGNVYYDYGVSYAYPDGGSEDAYTAVDIVSGYQTDRTYYAKSDILSTRLALSVSSSVDFLSSADFKNLWKSNDRDYSIDYGLSDYNITTSDGNLNSVIKSYASTMASKSDFAQWWDKLWNKELWEDEEGYADIKPIVQVDKDKVLTWNDEAIGNEYFMNNESVSEFKSFVSDNALKDNTIYVMRFAVRDFYSCSIDIYDKQNKTFGEYTRVFKDFSNVFYRRYLFDAFDVMETEWEDKEGKRSVLPVSATPITVTGGIVGPSVSNVNDPGPDDPSWWELFWEWFSNLNGVLKIIIGVAAIAVVIFILRLIWQAIGWIITGIGKGVGALFGFTERRVDKYREHKEHDEERGWKREEEERKRSEEKRKEDRHNWDKYDQKQKEREDGWRNNDRKRSEKQRREAESNRKTEEALKHFEAQVYADNKHKEILKKGKKK